MAIVCSPFEKAYLDVLDFIGQNKNFKAKRILARHSNFTGLLDSTNKSLLHISAKCGNATITRFLIESGSNVNAHDSKGETPLMLVPSRAASTAKMLLDADACMHATDAHGESALKKVIKNCRSEWSSLHEHRDILQVYYEQLKSHCSKETIARKLANAGCPLPVVMLLSDAELTRYMLENGCALDERAHGLTALHVAVQMADLDNVKLLLWYGANVDEPDRAAETPLCKYRMDTDDSAEKGEILTALLGRGASLNATMTKGFGNQELILERLLTQGQRETIFAVLKSMDLSAKYGPNEQTPLHFLVQNKNRAADDGIQLVISRKVDVNACDRKGRTPLIVAVAKGFTSRVAFLIANGAKANLIDVLEKTPMINEFTKQTGYREYEDNSFQKYYAKVFRLLLNYDVDFQSMPEKPQFEWDKDLILIKLALAYIVIAENDGRQLSASIQSLIKSRHDLREHYNCCKRQLEALKTITIHGSVTTYKLLTESEEKLASYVCNQELVADFQRFMRTRICRDSYYHYILQKRLGKAIQIANLRMEAASAICQITGLPANEHRHIVNKIVSYLSSQDFEILFLVAKRL